MEHSSQTRKPWPIMYNTLSIPVFCGCFKIWFKFDLDCRVEDKSARNLQ